MPFTVFWIILLVGLVLRWLKKRKSSRLILLLALIWLVLISFAPLPNLIIGSLERKYPPLTDITKLLSDTNIHILVLGSYHISDSLLPANDQLSDDALGRLSEGIRLHRLLPGSKIITSGKLNNDPVSNAKVAKNTACLLGVKPEDIYTLETPVNTEEEALCYLKRFGKDHKIIVVTNAAHMPRAILWFRKVGLDPLAAPTNHFIKHCPYKKSVDFFPSASHIIELQYAIHEYVGILWAKLKPESREE